MATNAELRTAIEWLMCNEGEDGESGDCQAAAEFLRRVVRRREIDALADRMGRETGLGPGMVRRTNAFKNFASTM